MELDEAFWTDLYNNDDTGWDIGSPSTPLKEYIDQLKDKEQKILIPGCGNSYEGQYMHEKGFDNVFILDISTFPLKQFSKRVPSFPKSHLLNENFFDHTSKYDLILEQTFFCALPPNMREAYAKHVHNLLKPGGQLVGVLFNDLFPDKEPNEPPFGGTKKEYLGYFKPLFDIKVFEKARNSIPPRKGREFFMVLEKTA